MCLPVVAAIATFATGALSSIAQYSQEQGQYQSQMQAYRASERNYAQQVEYNKQAADRAYQTEQLKLKGDYDKASQDAQALMVKSLQSQGTILASGRTGQSMGALVGDAQRQYGFDMANLASNLSYRNVEYGLATENIFGEAQSAMNVAASNRMLQPSKPGAAGLVLGLAGSVASGVGTFASLKAPNAGGGGGGGNTAKTAPPSGGSGGGWSGGGIGSSQYQPNVKPIYTPKK